MQNFRNTRAVVTHLAKFVSGKTLDFGAGSAKYRSIIIPYSSEYITFDMIKGEHIDVVGDALHPPFDNQSFNTVIATQVLEHVEKPWVVINRIKGILKNDGICIVTAPFLVPYHADPHDYFRYTLKGMESLFINEGFTIVESGTYGRTSSVWVELIYFSYFDHYERVSKIKNWFRGNFMNSLKKLAFVLDRIFHNKSVYTNVYVVARKVG